MTQANVIDNVSVRLREASQKDAALLASIHQRCFPNYWNSDAFTDFFSVSGTLAMVAESENGEALGMMVCRMLYEQADIITIAVLPDFRRCGIARNLLSHAMQQLASKGANTMFLDVEEGNDAAIKLYESYGFSYISRRKLYYRQKDGSFTDALVMKGVLG